MKRITMIIMFASIMLIFACSQKKGEAEQNSNVMMAPQGNTMMADTGTMDKNFFNLSGLAPAVVQYTGEITAMKAAADGIAVYFFSAVWCPTCNAAYRDISANVKKFPEGFTLIFVNYDTQKDLIKKYGITYQHTFVRIDKQGRAVNVWSGSITARDIVMKAGSI